MNEFDEFFSGVFFNNGDIGAGVGTRSPTDLTNGNVMGNIWTCTSCSSTQQRIMGNYSGTGLKWFTPTSVATDPDFPHTLIVGVTASPLLGSIVTNNSECTIPSDPFEDDPDVPISLRTRNDNFGGVVSDTNRYPEAIHEEIRYTNRLLVYKLLKKYPALLNFDDPSDTAFRSFYNLNQVSNLNKLDSVELLLTSRLFVAADSLLSNFNDTNTIEHNYRRAYQLYVKKAMIGDTSLTQNEINELYDIAYQHPLLGGKAVFVARNMLRLEVEDNLEGGYRLLAKKESGNKQLKIYPNPASSHLFIQLTETEKVDVFQLLDMTGRTVIEQQKVNEISVAILSPGLYLIQVKHEGVIYKDKLVISK